MKNEINTLSIHVLSPSPTNPRTAFDGAKQDQLAETIKQHGILQKLLVRPKPGAEGMFELVDGERRWRALKSIDEATRAQRGLDEVPVTIRDLSDAEVIEIQLISGETSEPLPPLDEGQGFKTALIMRGKDGQPCFTLRSLAQKLGCSHEHIRQRISLLELPELAIAAVVAGKLPARTAGLIARIPSAEDRLLAASDIVKPTHRTEPLTYKEAEALIHDRYMISLRAAPFDQADETLPGPDGTALGCAKCPLKTGNDPEKFGEMKDKNTCTNPGCYRSKCNAIWDRAAVAAKAKGRQVLTDEEAAKVFQPNTAEPEVRPESPYVDLNTKPTYRHVSNAVEDKNLPTWKDLIAGAEEKGITVPVVEARHRSGRRVELVKLEHAVEAAKKVGEDIFKKDSVGAVVRQTDDFAEKKKQEQDATKKRVLEACIGIVALQSALAAGPSKGGNDKLAEALLPIALHHAGSDGQALIVRAFNLKSEGGDFGASDAIEAWFKVASVADRHALVVVLLIAHDMKWNGLKSEGFGELARITKLDEKAIIAKAAAQLAAAKPGKKPGAPGTETKTQIKVTEDPKILAEWVKAHAAGMSCAAIAQSYKVPLADVEGALSSKRPAAKKSAPPKAKAAPKKAGKSKRGQKGAAK